MCGSFGKRHVPGLARLYVLSHLFLLHLKTCIFKCHTRYRTVILEN